MISTSSEFLDEVSTTNKLREAHFKLIFKQVDVTAKSDCIVTSDDTEYMTSAQNIVSGNTDIDRLYASYEPNRSKLDGSFALLPSAPYGDVGWWSSQLSDASTREFTDLKVTFQFSQNHSSVGFTIYWARITEEWAEDFDIVYYDESGVVLETVSVTGNTETLYVSEIGVANYRKIELLIYKWSTAGRRARIIEVEFGIIKEYSRRLQNLSEASVSEVLDRSNLKIISRKLDFRIDNTNDVYNMLNPTGIYQYLQQNQEIEAYAGFKIGGTVEYVPMGIYFLSSWETTETGLFATFTAYDILELMNTTTYYKGDVATTDLMSLAEDILSDYGINQYDLDDSLASIYTDGFIPIVSHKVALQYVAVAAGCTLYVNRYGIISIKQFNTVGTGITQEFTDMLSSPPVVSLSDPIRQVDVSLYTFSVAPSPSVIASTSLYIDGYAILTIPYDKPGFNVSASVDIGSITAETYFAGACILLVTSTGFTTITVSGYEVTSSKTITSVITANETGSSISIDNPLITNIENAVDIGTYLAAELENRDVLTWKSRGNPALELDDIVDVATIYQVKTNARITKQTFVYDGGLSAGMEVIG